MTLLSSVITTVQQVQTVRREAFVKENTFGQHVGAMFIGMKREFRFCKIIFCKMPPGGPPVGQKVFFTVGNLMNKLQDLYGAKTCFALEQG